VHSGRTVLPKPDAICRSGRECVVIRYNSARIQQLVCQGSTSAGGMRHRRTLFCENCAIWIGDDGRVIHVPWALISVSQLSRCDNLAIGWLGCRSFLACRNRILTPPRIIVFLTLFFQKRIFCSTLVDQSATHKVTSSVKCTQIQHPCCSAAMLLNERVLERHFLPHNDVYSRTDQGLILCI
jgi:hypothetical protein